jgi:predicted  nucleic acid-binding Zn-ribbon protein
VQLEIVRSRTKYKAQSTKHSFMTPEISHRCPSCGAAVREHEALFCPECGKALKDTSPTPAPAEPDGIVQNATAATPESGTPTFSAPARVEANASSHPHRIADKTRETLHRASAAASAAARGVIEEPVKQVEKLRHASTHVIEEASYDPSLRFVLVALGLFIVFLIVLVLSKVMG